MGKMTHGFAGAGPLRQSTISPTPPAKKNPGVVHLLTQKAMEDSLKGQPHPRHYFLTGFKGKLSLPKLQYQDPLQKRDKKYCNFLFSAFLRLFPMWTELPLLFRGTCFANIGTAQGLSAYGLTLKNVQP